MQKNTNSFFEIEKTNGFFEIEEGKIYRLRKSKKNKRLVAFTEYGKVILAENEKELHPGFAKIVSFQDKGRCFVARMENVPYDFYIEYSENGTVAIPYDEFKEVLESLGFKHEYQEKINEENFFDVWAVDDNGVRYNIEVQNANEGADPKRARYNVERADSEVIAKSTDYKNFPELYVIMITKEDVLQKGLPIYHVERYIKETMTPFGDAEHVIYVNGSAKDANTPLGQLMRDMQEPDASKIDCPELASRMVEIKHGEEIDSMCQELQEERLKGIEKGVAETQLKCVKDVVEGFHVSIDEAFEKLHVPEKDRDAIRKKLNM